MRRGRTAPILVSTGGGTDVKLSLDNELEWTSPDIDVISLHSYEDRHDIVSAVEKGLKLAQKHGKHLIVEEVGFKGPNKASEIKSLVKSLKSLGVPFFHWQIVSGPGKGEEDYEISPDEVDSWKALLDWRFTDRVRMRGGRQTANRAPNIAELYQSAEQQSFFSPRPRK